MLFIPCVVDNQVNIVNQQHKEFLHIRALKQQSSGNQNQITLHETLQVTVYSVNIYYKYKVSRNTV